MESFELMTILEQLERDKGIEKEVLIEAVETAVASAAKKLWTVDKNEEIRVVLNKKTGKLTAYAGEQEIRSSEFGRIAAQTAKQVVIQKIREAEKDVVYTEYHSRIGEIISGSVYRFEKGNIIVDFGKAEGYIPKREQSSHEEFRQGDRIRALIVDVRKDARGPQIVLSRSNPQFVKKLFQLEVPEIYEGIVEIKAISRDVGERTKIAVYSKDEKVDCVGACVGMRGSRVKNIVNELQGEKIDIVRYVSDIKEYIQVALSPAEISQIQLSYDEKKANIIVADDQLSLAIGRHGQNVRLASELVGWDLDLYSFDQWKEYTEQEDEEEIVEEVVEDDGDQDTEETATPEENDEGVESETEAEDGDEDGDEDADADTAEETDADEQTADDEVSPLAVFADMDDKTQKLLMQAGFDSVEKISESNIDDLAAIKGIDEEHAQAIMKEAKRILA